MSGTGKPTIVIGAGVVGVCCARYLQLHGEQVTLRFQVDSSVFVDNPSFPTRGYAIEKSTFRMLFESSTVTLASPFPAGMTPYFVIRNDDPGVDGFFIADTKANGLVAGFIEKHGVKRKLRVAGD